MTSLKQQSTDSSGDKVNLFFMILCIFFMRETHAGDFREFSQNYDKKEFTSLTQRIEDIRKELILQKRKYRSLKYMLNNKTSKASPGLLERSLKDTEFEIQSLRSQLKHDVKTLNEKKYKILQKRLTSQNLKKGRKAKIVSRLKKMAIAGFVIAIVEGGRRYLSFNFSHSGDELLDISESLSTLEFIEVNDFTEEELIEFEVQVNEMESTLMESD